MMQNGYPTITISLLLLPKIKKFGDLIYYHVLTKQLLHTKIMIMIPVEHGLVEIYP